MAQKFVMTDGVKSIPLNSLPPEAWTEVGDSMGNSHDRKLGDLFSLVGIVNRCVMIRGSAFANLPWTIDDLSGNEVITSTDKRVDKEWKWLGDFTRNMFLLESSLTILSRSFLYEEPVFNRKPDDPLTRLRWLSATSTRPKWDGEQGIVGYLRRISASEERELPFDATGYFWYPSPMSEVDYAPSPVQAALQSANVIASLDQFAKQFFERGAIKATILQVDGSTPVRERQKLKDWWERVTTGLGNAWRTEVASSAVNPIVVGEGIAEIANTQITRDKAMSVATDMGVPASILFANAANYATSTTDERNFYTYTISPDASFIQEEMNKKFFLPRGFYLSFHPEQLDCFQESSVNRATVVKTYTESGLPLIEALEVAGVTISDGMKKKLELLANDQQNQKAEAAKQTPENDTAKKNSDEATKELTKFRHWMRKRLSKGTKAVASDFESEYITDEEKVDISRELLDELWGDLPSEELDIKGLILQSTDDDDEEVAKRLPLEQRMANIIASELRSQQAQVLAGNEDKMDLPPSEVNLGPLTNAPTRIAGTTSNARDALRQALIEGVDLGVKVASTQFGTIGLGFDYTLVNKDARQWADAYSYELVNGINETTQAHLRQTIKQWIDNGLPLRNLKRELAPIFGRDRAELIATTEVTRAYAQGNRAAYEGSGVVKEVIWRCSSDERMCPVCGALEDKRGSVKTGFAGVRSGFPPAHPRCRCWIVPYIEVPGEVDTPPTPTSNAVAEAELTPGIDQNLLTSKSTPDASFARTFESVHAAELAIRNLPIEHGYIFNPKTGELLHQAVGEAQTVDLGEAWDGNIVLHNHPPEPENMVYPGSFSISDVNLAFKYGAQEMRVASERYTYVMKIAPEYANGSEGVKFMAKAMEKRIDLGDDLRDTMPKTQWLAVREHLTWQKMADEHPEIIKYGRFLNEEVKVK